MCCSGFFAIGIIVKKKNVFAVVGQYQMLAWLVCLFFSGCLLVISFVSVVVETVGQELVSAYLICLFGFSWFVYYKYF